MSLSPPSPEIVVAGGGTAALCAALSAADAGGRVTLLEQAPRARRGGNTRHARNLRLAHDQPSALFPGTYGADEFLGEVSAAAHQANDPALTRLLIAQSASLPAWFTAHGIAFQTVACRGLPWSRRTAFFLGGGMAMLNTLYDAAERRGVSIRYDTELTGIEPDGTITLLGPTGTPDRLRPRAVIVATGGYQANLDRLRPGWGAVTDRLVNRGTPYALGRPLFALWELGAARTGSAGCGHLVAVDGRGPAEDGGIVTRIDGLARGLVVDQTGRRLTEETAITGPHRYSVWGRLVAGCAGALAWAIFDSPGVANGSLVSIHPPISAPDLGSLAVRLDLDPALLAASVAEVAERLAQPPFHAFPIRPGLTFTSEGVRIDGSARVLDAAGRPLPGLYAAGMIMAPSIIGTGYLAGMGLTIGAVFGIIAGETAVRDAGL